jgi:hypothetical protein
MRIEILNAEARLPWRHCGLDFDVVGIDSRKSYTAANGMASIPPKDWAMPQPWSWADLRHEPFPRGAS